MSVTFVQLRAELRRVAGNGEQLLLTLGIPVLLLVFFSLVDVLPTGTKDPIDFLAPGILALATMSTAMVSLGIGTGFERSYHVLKRLGTTPLGRPRLIAAKIGAVIAVEVVQFAVLIPVAYMLGWSPSSPDWLLAIVGVIVGTYSSIFIASPVLIWLNEKYVTSQRKVTARAGREARRPKRAGEEIEAET